MSQLHVAADTAQDSRAVLQQLRGGGVQEGVCVYVCVGGGGDFLCCPHRSG